MRGQLGDSNYLTNTVIIIFLVTTGSTTTNYWLNDTSVYGDTC